MPYGSTTWSGLIVRPISLSCDATLLTTSSKRVSEKSF